MSFLKFLAATFHKAQAREPHLPPPDPVESPRQGHGDGTQPFDILPESVLGSTYASLVTDPRYCAWPGYLFDRRRRAWDLWYEAPPFDIRGEYWLPSTCTNPYDIGQK